MLKPWDVTKGSVYRYAVNYLKNNPINDEEQEDTLVSKRPKREGFLEQKILDAKTIKTQYTTD